MLLATFVGDGLEIDGTCYYTIGGTNSKEAIEFFRILRVAVVRLQTGAPSSAYTHAHHVLPVVYRSFAPQLISVAAEDDELTTGGASTSSSAGQRRRRRPENMKETFAKVIVELLNTGSDELMSYEQRCTEWRKKLGQPISLQIF